MRLGGRPGLFIAEGVDGVETAGTVGGIDAEEEADGHGEEDGDSDGVETDDGAEVVDEGGGGNCAAGAEGDAEQAADEGEGDGFDEELAEDVAAFCANGFAEPDLAGSFGDADEHDVHDADAADDEADKGDGAEEEGHCAKDVSEDGDEVGLVDDDEVVFALEGDFVAFAQEFGYLFLGLGHAVFGDDRGVDEVDFVVAADGAAAEKAVLDGGEWE